VTSVSNLKRILPQPLRRFLRWIFDGVRRRLFVHPVADFEKLRRVIPLSRNFGLDRGRPIDRYYIENFLAAHAEDIRGHVLEIQNDSYTRQFGGIKVTRGDVLDIDRGNPKATILADLTQADHVPSDTFDSIICTQTLLLIYDVKAAVRTLHRILKPGGVILVTVPGISHQISRYDMDRGGDYWRFTTKSIRRLFEECFPPEQVHVESRGNVLAAMGFLHGLTVEELRPDELEHQDPDYEVSIGLRAAKPR
jgi:SAM-dependent methyltransferase